MSIVWQLHRDDFDFATNTVRGILNGRGRSDAEIIVLQTVENLSRRIPSGHDYTCRRDFYHGGQYEAFEIEWPWDEDGDGRPDRDRLLIHAANAVRNRGGELSLLGCVAPGLARVDRVWETFYPGEPLHDLAKGLPGVSSSRTALKNFMQNNRGLDEFLLRVTEVSPP